MESVLIGAVAQSVISVVINPVVEKAFNAKKKKLLKKEIEDLEELLTRLMGYLQDAEQKQSKNESVRLWLAEIEDIVYDAEDLMDEYVADVECVKTEKEPITERWLAFNYSLSSFTSTAAESSSSFTTDIIGRQEKH